MTDKEKIELADLIIRFISDRQTSKEEIPVKVGSLTKAQGVNSFKTANVGHPVFEFKDRYVIYLESIDGRTTVCIPYYKQTLKPVIDFEI